MFLHCKKGLDCLTNDQVVYLRKYLARSFPIGNIDDLLLHMASGQMDQFFLMKNNKPIAVVSFHKKGYLSCTGTYFTNVLYNVATAPYYRKKGYMKKLLRHVISHTQKQKRKYIHLEVLKTNEKAINLYKKLGFQIIYECMPTSTHQGIYLMRLCLS